MIETLMKDEVLDVRLNLIKNISGLNVQLGPDGIKRHLIPMFNQIQQEKQWRFRLSFCEYIPTFYSQLGKSIFDDCFMSFLEIFYTDHYAAIRSQCFTNFLTIAQEKKFDVVKSYFETAINSMKSNTNYIFRVSAIDGFLKL